MFSHHLGWSLPTPANRLAMIWLAEQAKCGTAQARGPHVLLTTAHLRDRWQAWRQQVQSILECQLITDEPKNCVASHVCFLRIPSSHSIWNIWMHLMYQHQTKKTTQSVDSRRPFAPIFWGLVWATSLLVAGNHWSKGACGDLGSLPQAQNPRVNSGP